MLQPASLAMPRAHNKISFCVICMNRLYHLEQTLIKNIINNADYSDLEVILLDYNSKDEMEEWSKKALGSLIEEGKITYYKTFEPSDFSHSHAKNLAFKLASGDIVCNINADNFVNRGFTAYIDSVFQNDHRVFMAPRVPIDPSNAGASGAVCAKRTDFLEIGGFDEKMQIYGWEDLDFNNRLQFLGIEQKPIREGEFLRSIDHKEKYDREKLLSRIRGIYINHINPVNEPSSKVLILFKDGTYKSGTIINNIRRSLDDHQHARLFEARKHRFPYELEEVYWKEGYWDEETNIVTLFDNDRHTTGNLQKVVGSGINALSQHKDELLYQVTHPDLLQTVIFFELYYNNTLIMIDNLENRKTVVNEGKFGQARVFKNFNYDTAIEID